MRSEARQASTEAHAQRSRCAVIRSENDQLRARLHDRYPGRFAGGSQDAS
jgi:hypothetical protein